MYSGMSVDKLSENWKEKGGFEGLMANPGFLLGMSILQSSAQGNLLVVEYLMRQLKLEQFLLRMQIELKLELQLLHLLVMLNVKK
jgi:hypothetical protein